MNTVPQAPAIMSSKQQRVTSLFPGVALGQLVDGITTALHSSFKAQVMRVPTDDEKRRRFGICMDWAVILRGDMKWGVQRIVGAMPEILKTTLAGEKWQPSQRQCWIPEDGR